MRDERKTVKSRWELDSEDILQGIRKKPENEQKKEQHPGEEAGKWQQRKRQH